MKQVPCDLCGGDDATPVVDARRDHGPVVRCRTCSLVYQSPRNELPTDWSEAYSDTEEEFYLEQYVHEEEAKRRSAGKVLDVLERFVEPGRMLEVGSAGGFYLDVARDRGWDVVGIEPHSPVAKWSQQRFGLDVHIGTLDDHPWEPGSFDAVVLYNTLEHLPSARAALDVVAGLLRPGGVVAIQVPKADSLAARVLRHRWRHYIRYHYYFFTEATMTDYFRRAGLRLVDATTAPKVATLGFVTDRLWELHYVPRAVADRLRSWLGRRELDQRTITFDPRDDLLVHARRP